MYEIYTDGSCLGNPGRGGWGAIGEGMKLGGNLRGTTNNVMESCRKGSRKVSGIGNPFGAYFYGQQLCETGNHHVDKKLETEWVEDCVRDACKKQGTLDSTRRFDP